MSTLQFAEQLKFRLQKLVAYNNYSDELLVAIEDFIITGDFLLVRNNKIALKLREDIINLYLDYVILCIGDNDITESEKSELSYLRNLFSIKENEIYKMDPTRVKEICLQGRKTHFDNQFKNNTAFRESNFHLAWALGLSYQQFYVLSELDEIEKPEPYDPISNEEDFTYSEPKRRIREPKKINRKEQFNRD